ncbi:Hemoglobin-binding protein A [Liparis tanakae]|uniref:Hemoglobin-binding protein A n=1 Tax=Liparis tanakae TaxID=230148 RepID=A0A4Z2EIX8_9TELE|nr:Hemoglobin-binding protein A [Liparis tanakae]
MSNRGPSEGAPPLAIRSRAVTHVGTGAAPRSKPRPRCRTEPSSRPLGTGGGGAHVTTGGEGGHKISWGGRWCRWCSHVGVNTRIPTELKAEQSRAVLYDANRKEAEGIVRHTTQSTTQPPNHPTNQSTNHPTNQPTTHPTN